LEMDAAEDDSPGFRGEPGLRRPLESRARHATAEGQDPEIHGRGRLSRDRPLGRADPGAGIRAALAEVPGSGLEPPAALPNLFVASHPVRCTTESREGGHASEEGG